MKWTLKLYAVILTVLFLKATGNVNAQKYEANSNIQFLYGKSFAPESKDLATITLEHIGSYRSFEHFGFADFLYYHNNKEGEFSIYAEWYPKISLLEVSGLDLKLGPLNNVLFGAGVNALVDSDFLVYIAGPVWQFNIPGFDFFQLETYYYKQQDIGDIVYKGTYQLTLAWDAPMPVSEKLIFRTRGFADFIGDRGPGEAQIITQPQLLLDVGNFRKKPGRIFAGTEWRYWHNQAGIAGTTESIVQLELLYSF